MARTSDVVALDPRLLALRPVPRSALEAGARWMVEYLESAGGHVSLYRDADGRHLYVHHGGASPTVAELRAALAGWPDGAA